MADNALTRRIAELEADLDDAWGDVEHWRSSHTADVGSLSAEVERLREALRDLDQACENELGGFYLSDPGQLGQARDKAREAMGGGKR